jgi:NADH:ubiquinone oxidoreductase subunit 6 (subunit J)
VLYGQDYLNAVQVIAQRHDFGPYLLWLGQNTSVNLIARLLQVVAYVLAATLVGPLVQALWPNWLIPEARRLATPTQLVGWVGFGLFALTLLGTAVISINFANTYRLAETSQRAALAAQFAGTYALGTILAQVIAGALIVAFLGCVCARMATTHVFPRWLPYLGVLVMILLAANALLFAFGPTQVLTFVTTPATAGLAIWLAGLGILLVRLRALPLAPAGEPVE